MATVAENRAQYLAWLREHYPDLYRRVVGNASPLYAPQLNGFWDSLTTGFSNVLTGVSQALPNITTAYSQYASTRQLLEANTQRARAGLAPLQLDANGRMVTASGLPYSDEEYRIASSGLSQTTMLAIGAAGVLVLALLLKRR